MYILAYVDDILITGRQLEKKKMDESFSLKLLGSLSYFLGIEVKRDRGGMHLNQTKYIHDLLRKTNMQDFKECRTPIGTGIRYRREMNEDGGKDFEDKTMYKSVVGALQYATIIRPDITYSVNKMSWFMQEPKQTRARVQKKFEVPKRKSKGFTSDQGSKWT